MTLETYLRKINNLLMGRYGLWLLEENGDQVRKAYEERISVERFVEDYGSQYSLTRIDTGWWKQPPFRSIP